MAAATLPWPCPAQGTQGHAPSMKLTQGDAPRRNSTHAAAQAHTGTRMGPGSVHGLTPAGVPPDASSNLGQAGTLTPGSLSGRASLSCVRVPRVPPMSTRTCPLLHRLQPLAGPSDGALQKASAWGCDQAKTKRRTLEETAQTAGGTQRRGSRPGGQGRLPGGGAPQRNEQQRAVCLKEAGVRNVLLLRHSPAHISTPHLSPSG